MNLKNTLLHVLDELANELENLSESDINKIVNGEYKISLKITRKNTPIKNNNELSEERINNVLFELKKCKDRMTGHDILNREFKNKKELESFAKAADVFILKQDKVETIKDKVIESIIGATLRSLAIQGEAGQINDDNTDKKKF
ncbi:hypothetical protein ACET75_06375 [Aeromonas veronii]